MTSAENGSGRPEKDVEVLWRRGRSGIAVIAPHGGMIEPGTTELARAVAGQEHSFYSFCGLRARDNAALHRTSHRFDEPAGLQLVAEAERVLSIHGCAGQEPVVYLGGTDAGLREKIRQSLAAEGFAVGEDPRFPGKHPQNICNRGRSGRGVQLELTTALRRKLLAETGAGAGNGGNKDLRAFRSGASPGAGYRGQPQCGIASE